MKGLMERLHRLPARVMGLLLLLSLAACSLQTDFLAGGSPPFPSLIPGAEPLEPVADVDVLALSPAMRQLLDRRVGRHGSRRERMAALRQLFFDRRTLPLRYQRARTGTAAQTFESGAADCVSFANLVVAMARYVGLDAYYQNVQVPSNWEKDGELAVLKRHINALVSAGDYAEVYDFFGAEGNTAGSVVIGDRIARAQYFNNLGIGYFQAGRAALALRYLQRAALLDPGAGFIWSNIGIVYSDNGRYPEAERFLRRALVVAPDDMSARVNLAELYGKEGRDAEAAAMGREVEAYRLRNPYYRYELAEDAFAAGHWRDAVHHLQMATRIKQDAAFYLLLAQSYSREGRIDEALRSYRRAIALRPGSESGACCGREPLAAN